MPDKRDWAVKITKAENGYFCEWWEEIDDNVFSRRVHLVEELQYDDLQAMRDLLYFIKDHFAIFYSKHNSRNIIINVEKHGTE